tara:strand:- start:4286 stop:4888 length:603 start_codon:yes stop_codon:yes gene_type:complete
MTNVIKRGRGRPRLTASSPLTRRQEKFVKEMVSNDGMITKKEAATRAGYSEKTASAKATSLTNPDLHPNVCAAIQRYQAELDQKYGITFARHVRDLQRIRDLALENGAYSAAVQAEYRRGQAQGNIYVNKSEIRHGSIDSMSREEVERELQEIRKAYGNDVIDVTPIEKDERSSAVRIEDLSRSAEIIELETERTPADPS